MDINIRKIRELYKEDNLVPFIGAGLSKPFNIPDWKQLITRLSDEYMENFKHIKPTVNEYLNNNNFWSAMETILEFAPISESDIQEEIVRIIDNQMRKSVNNNDHNYLDLANLNFKVYLTTNYDHLLTKYINEDNCVPLILNDIDFSTQNLFSAKKKRVFHLHGHISNPGTIVITKDQYKKLYNSKKYDNILKLFTGNKSLLFIGFSFDDQFIKEMIKDHKDYFKGNHFILLDNPSNVLVKELKKDYGLNVIKYDSSRSNHSVEIRKILCQLENKNDADCISEIGISETNLDVIELKDTKRNDNQNLSDEKLEIKNITKNNIKAKILDNKFKNYLEIENIIKTNFEIYWTRIFSLEEHESSNGIKIIKNNSKDIKFLKETMRKWEIEIKNYYESIKSNFEIDMFDNDNIDRYEYQEFKENIFAKDLWTVKGALKQASYDSDMEIYRKNFMRTSAVDIFSIIRNILIKTNSYIDEYVPSIRYNSVKCPEQLKINYLDEKGMLLTGVIGLGIRSELLHRLYPGNFAIMTRRSLWGMYFLSGESSEFLTDEKSNDGKRHRTSHNWEYEYDRFMFYNNFISKMLENKLKLYSIKMNQNLRFGYVNLFLNEIYKLYQDRIDILFRWNYVEV